MRLTVVTWANIAFWSLWLLALLWCKFNSFDDPSSIFYNQEIAYSQRYSAQRGAQVDEFFRSNSGAPSSGNRTSALPPSEQLLCIGIPSINRTSEGFLAHTVGSLVDTLSPAERKSIHIAVLLADKTPTEHFAYGQPWLSNLADEVLVYEQPGADHDHADYRTIPYNNREDGQPRGDGRVENMRLDHSVLVETCRSRGTPYFAFIEDDVIASPDWFKKFSAGVAQVEDFSKRSAIDWLYLRLFYSEIFMGWNSEEWPQYFGVIGIVYAVAIIVLLELRRRRHGRISCTGRHKYAPLRPVGDSRHTFNYLSALVLGLWLPAGISLVFLAGRISLARLNPFPRPAVREMPRYGCCAQGLVFPSRHLSGFQSLLRDPPFDFAGDMLLEDYAGRNNLKKWALEPSVLQHVGLKESSEGVRIAEVWNFSFERGRDFLRA
ncbi:hypothetical protein K4F52_010047 [Lecanicillium sp. MT-2017a]|nr:hypothetical protein K4F52_010047 [Lecanicillium sp. MT-2017a]